MRYTFSRPELLALVSITENATKCHVPYTGGDWGTPEESTPGLNLVGDDGVYFVSNAEGQTKGANGKLSQAYANECNPDKMDFDSWWDAKRAGFGGDDGAEFFALPAIVAWLASTDGDVLTMEIGSSGMELLGSRPKKPTKVKGPRANG